MTVPLVVCGVMGTCQTVPRWRGERSKVLFLLVMDPLLKQLEVSGLGLSVNNFYAVVKESLTCHGREHSGRLSFTLEALGLFRVTLVPCHQDE